MTKTSNPKQRKGVADVNCKVSVIGILNLDFIWILVFVYWCLYKSFPVK